jgi:putative zinc finger/helix-turn-helix YgiT family protein
MNKTVFCAECRKDVGFVTKETVFKRTLKDNEYSFIGLEAYCADCGSPIYVSEIEDNNLKLLYDAYRKANDIISLDEILSIPKKYAIGKRPLSLLLGWGEQTFTRYCNGDMPSKQYSDILRRLYNEPTYYNELLQNNKDRMKSNSSYEKSNIAVKNLIGIPENSKIETVIGYLLYKCEDVTPLALQKLLYYVQGFFYAFNNVFIFEDDCEAWVHGPVYRKVYHKYSDYKYDTIDSADSFDETIFSVAEKAVIDSIVDNFSCYSGKVLESFTHSEQPWIETRSDLPVFAQSDRVINKKLIADYFTAVKQKYEMLNPDDIENYSKKLVAMH